VLLHKADGRIVEEYEATEEDLWYKLENVVDNHGRPFSYILKKYIGKIIDGVYHPCFVVLTKPDIRKATDLFLDFYRNRIEDERLKIKGFGYVCTLLNGESQKN